MALGGALGLAWSPVTPGMPRHFAWQAWHKITSTVVLRGRRGTNSHPPSFCVAGVALMALGGALGLAWSPVTPGTPRHFAWQAWQATNSHPPSFCVAGVALMALGGALGLAWSPVTPGTPRHFAWQAWHKLTSTRRFAWQAWHKLTSTVVLRGRRGTHGTGWRAWTGLVARDATALCVAGVAQTHIHRRFCVAGVAQPHIHCRFAWQEWHTPHRHTDTHTQTHTPTGQSEIGHLHAKMRSLLVVERQGSTALQQRCAAADMTDSVSCMQTFIMLFLSFCFGPTRSCSQQL